MRKDLFDKLLLNSASAILLSGVIFNGYQIFAASFAQMPFFTSGIIIGKFSFQFPCCKV